jgi:gamma-glutamyltranspeptidase/glutathione hydrolase
VLSGGSPGGALIIHFTAKLLLGTLDWGLGPQEAIDLLNFSPMDEVLLLESGGFPASTACGAGRARPHSPPGAADQRHSGHHARTDFRLERWGRSAA